MSRLTASARAAWAQLHADDFEAISQLLDSLDSVSQDGWTHLGGVGSYAWRGSRIVICPAGRCLVHVRVASVDDENCIVAIVSD